MNVLNLFRLLRVEQWYKNTIIFIAIIFSFNLFNKYLFFLIFLGFLALCFVSSSYYIINDIVDIEKDKIHPEKKTRPLASKKISIFTALIFSLILFDISLFISYLLSKAFLISILCLFLLSQFYTFFVRNLLFLDIIFISINFVIRAISGAFIINEQVSYWVILSTFFLSTFLVSSKRFIEISSDYANSYRPFYNSSNKKVLEYFSVISIACVFIFFSIYSIITEKPLLLLSLPVSIYIVLAFFNTMYSNPEMIRNPEKFIFDKKILIALLIWLLIIIITLYSFI